jgi:hypothetical protein
MHGILTFRACIASGAAAAVVYRLLKHAALLHIHPNIPGRPCCMCSLQVRATATAVLPSCTGWGTLVPLDAVPDTCWSYETNEPLRLDTDVGSYYSRLCTAHAEAC